MAIIKSDKLEQANRSLLASYDQFATTIPSRVEAFTTVESITTEAYTHPFISGIANPRVWIGERLSKDPAIKEINGKALPYEVTVEARVQDVNSSIIGRYVKQMADLGQKTAYFKDLLVSQLLNNGTSTSFTIDGYTKTLTNYDGLATFSSSHVLDDGTAQSNNFTSTALNYTNLVAKYNVMLGYKNDLGIPLGITPTYLVVPPALAMQAKSLVTNTLINDGNNAAISNVMQGSLEVVVLPFLTDSTTWFILGTKAGINPFTYYEFLAPTVTVVDQPDSYPVFVKNVVAYGWQATADMNFGPYQLLIRCIA